MIYFRCSVGGSGKGNTVTVTCAEEFAGLPITLAKIGKTYTKTCPSTAPYVVTFNGVENGTYTVSTTVEGQTYAETVVVQNISCVLNYGFNWKLWVDTASQLDSTDYNTLDELLADEEAVRELMLEHACVDYMAEATSSNANLETIIENDLCAKWINNSDYALDFLGANTVIKALMDEADKYGYGEWVITDDTTTPPTWGPNGNVPKMTSNTAPYGEASAYQVFDGNASTTASGTDFSYKFVNPICPKDFYCNVSGGTLQASNDGSTWSAPTSGSYYLYLRLHFASSVSPHTIQFYGRELKVSVPTMTSNTAPYGEAFASSSYPSSGNYIYLPWKAFDGVENNIDNNWASASNKNVGEYLGYDFKKKVIVKAIKIVQRAKRYMKQAKLQGSNDGTTWEDITSSITVGVGTTTPIFMPISNEEAFSQLRLICTEQGGDEAGHNVNVMALQFYGLDYSEKEFEVGTTKKWLYDHGVKLDVIAESGSIVWADSCFSLQAVNALVARSYPLTNFSVDRCKVGEHMSGTTDLRVMGSGNTVLAQSNLIASNSPNNNGLDISSINDTQTLRIQMTSAGICDITEWWLE